MSITIGSISATAAARRSERDTRWQAYRFSETGYCDDCGHVTASWALADCWVSDLVGTWPQWTCPRCLDAIRGRRDLWLEVLGYGFCEAVA